MRLILVRHGETAWNEERRVQGQADTELSERGRQQAEEVASALKGEAIQAIYSSPLKRALETAQAIARHHGLEVQVGDTLKELDTGELDGLTFTEIRSHFQGFMELWARDPGPARLPGGECLQELQDRAWPFILGLKERHPQGTVVVVSHNFALQAILCRALDLHLSCFRRLRLDVASRSILDLGANRPTLLLLNDTCPRQRP